MTAHPAIVKKSSDVIHLYIMDYHIPYLKSGLGTYVRELSQSLKEKKDVVLHHIWVAAKNYTIIEKEIDNDGVVNIYVPKDVGVFNKPTGQDIVLAEYLRHEMKGKSNVILHFNWINHIPFTWLLRQRTNCKVLLTKHCIPFRDLILTNYTLFSRFHHWSIGKNVSPFVDPILKREKVGYDLMDHIICVSHFAKNSLKNLMKVNGNNISVIYNGLQIDNPAKSRVGKISLKEKYGFDKKEKIVLVAGRISALKGVYDLCSAFEALLKQRKLLKVRLVFAGQGEHSQLISHVRQHWSRITITGGLDKKQLDEFYSIADIGIVPSYVEQCSYTAIEMMHHGIPIIVSNIDGLKEIVPDDCGLKVNLLLGKEKARLNTSDLTRKLLLLLEDEQLAKEYGKKAKAYAAKHFTAPRMVAQTMEIYRKLLTAKPAQHSETAANGKAAASLVSIIMPCLNAERFIFETISSILIQPYQRFELIIVDGGSTDKTESIIRSFTDTRIKFIKTQQPAGIGKSLNIGLGLAEGEYIARVDSDDFVEKERFRKQLAYLKKHPDIAMVGSIPHVIDQTGRLISYIDYPESDKDIRTHLFFQIPFCRATIMARAAVIRKIKYSEKYKYCEDFHLWFKVAARYKIGNLQEPLTACRVHGKNVSIVHLKEQRENALELISDQLDKLGIEYSPPELALHAAVCFGYGSRYFNSVEKVQDLKAWIGKVQSACEAKSTQPVASLEVATKYILWHCCGFNN